MATTKTLSALIQLYFGTALPQRGFSPRTVLSYRDAIKLLLKFTSARTGRAVVALNLVDIDAPAVVAFLEHLEASRGNEIVTRNNRLAALRSFFTFVAAEEPTLADHCKRVCAIPLKRAPTRSIPYLEEDEMHAILRAPDRATPAGRRDHAMLLFLYNTGARVEEMLGVRACDMRLLDPHRQVLLRGKGKKERIAPLWRETVPVLRNLLEEMGLDVGSSERVFRNRVQTPMTRFGALYVLRKHAATAAQGVPSIAKKRISPHTIRHTTAVHLLNAGVDITVIQQWLGHVNLRTTHIYAEMNLEAKRRALETCAPGGAIGDETPSWKRRPDILAWLEAL